MASGTTSWHLRERKPENPVVFFGEHFIVPSISFSKWVGLTWEVINIGALCKSDCLDGTTIHIASSYLWEIIEAAHSILDFPSHNFILKSFWDSVPCTEVVAYQDPLFSYCQKSRWLNYGFLPDCLIKNPSPFDFLERAVARHCERCHDFSNAREFSFRTLGECKFIASWWVYAVISLW